MKKYFFFIVFLSCCLYSCSNEKVVLSTNIMETVLPLPDTHEYSIYLHADLYKVNMGSFSTCQKKIKIKEPIIVILQKKISYELEINPVGGNNPKQSKYEKEYDEKIHYLPNLIDDVTLEYTGNHQEIITKKWFKGDTLYLNNSWSFWKEKKDSIVYVNGVKMVQIDPENLAIKLGRSDFIINDLLNQLPSNQFYMGGADECRSEDVYKQPSYSPFLYNETKDQSPFKTAEMLYYDVVFFPRSFVRNHVQANKIGPTFGVQQFFMDHDLTDGFVHSYTQNFHKWLPDSGFSLCFKRSSDKVNEAIAYYKRKSDLDANDILGQNMAFCRQWKLSEWDIVGDELIKMELCNFNKNCLCPQVKKDSKSKYKPEIPLWNSSKDNGGYHKINDLNSLDSYKGGTAVIMWEGGNHEVRFIDIHNSIKEILKCAINIRDRYKVDPSIGIYDAGSFGRKFRADKTNYLDFNYINSKTGSGKFVGAGYGVKIN